MTEIEFLKDVEHHVMEVLRDDGLYRHIRFRKPGTMCMHFDFVTWPGYLAYTGDMGTYVFTRLADMFEFFRTDRAYAQRNGRQLGINLSYWSEKLQAVDGNRRNGSAKEFSRAKFEAVIKSQVSEWMRDRAMSKSGRRELREEIVSQIIDVLDDDNGHEAYGAANRFSERIDGRTYHFQDLWDHDFTDYTHRFTWCCYALAWGIETYDTAKAVMEPA